MKLKNILLLTLCVFFCTFTSAQTLYELIYHFDLKNGREDYRAFAFRNDDGTGFIRLAYTDNVTRSANLVEMQMQESFGMDDNDNPDTTLLIFVGLDQRQILGTIMYKPDNFVFQLNKETDFYEPAFVLSINDDGTEDIGVLDNVRLLQQEDLTKELVLQYFTEKDDFYINLFETTVRGLTPQQQSTRLLLLLVANTEDISIGATCAVDRDATHKTFGQVAEYLGIQFVPQVISGKKFSKVNVDNAINSLRPSPKDIVVFYYTGHGFNNEKDPKSFPYLDLRDKTYQTYGEPYTLNIEDIYKRIKAKGARLNLIISDCCNADPSQGSVVSANIASTRSSSIGWNMYNCRTLFMNDKPLSVLMTAASKGELSAGNTNTGGIFTFNFRESLENYMGPFFHNVTWQTVLQSSQKHTVTKASNTLCPQPDKSFKVCKQSPLFRIE
jgi:hypothetical protein